MYGTVISFILLFPWALVALATAGHLRSRRPWPSLGASNVEGLPTSFDLRYRACYHIGGET